MKKTISLILAAIMIISAVPIQSLAIFDWFYPTVEKVEFSDNTPVSNKNVQSYEFYLEHLDFIPVYGMGGSYDYTYKVYFSNGVVVDVVDNYIDYRENPDLLRCRVEAISIFANVDPAECQKAVDEGKSTIKVDIGVETRTRKGEYKLYEFEMEKEIVPEIVKDISLADTMPESYDKDEPTLAFIGKKFEVEYSDGRKEIYTLEDKGDYNYSLGGEPVGLWYGEDEYIDEATGETVYYEGLSIYYIDTNSVIEKKLIPCPYENFEVLDHKFDGKGHLTGLTYRITYKDGNTLEKTLTFEDGLTNDEVKVIDTVDGNDIAALYGVSDYTYWLDVYLGHDIWEMYDNIEGDATDVCDCRCHKESALDIILTMFLTRIWEIFRIKEYCQCGYWHW